MKTILILFVASLAACGGNINTEVIESIVENNDCNTETVPINEGDSEQILIAKNALQNQRLIDCNNAMYGTNQSAEELKEVF